KGNVDWDAILRSKADPTGYLSVRGRNILFIEALGDALQLDRIEAPLDLPTFKRAFTASAVVKIYEAVHRIWPPDTDLAKILARSKDEVAGLYVGDYAPEYLHRALVRHSTYAS